MDEGQVIVVLEDLRAQFKGFGEALESNMGAVRRDIRGLTAKISALTDRVTGIESTLNGARPRDRRKTKK